MPEDTGLRFSSRREAQGRSRALSLRIIFTLALVAGIACEAVRPETTAAPAVEVVDVRDRQPGWLSLPNQALSVKLAIIGDSGRGNASQRDVGLQLAAYREKFSFDSVLMLGDNIYEGPASPEDYRLKFELPYRELLGEKVKFRAVLGNHDDPNQRFYEPFGMGGERYYTFTVPSGIVTPLQPRVQVFALDSTGPDVTQRAWLARELEKSRASWKICLMHHPLYSSGRYQQYVRIHRWALESLFVEHDVDVVFSGHEHFYERLELQSGVQYFISGGAGSVRQGDASPASFVARAFDDDCHFMLLEITRDALFFQAISRTGVTIDAGVLRQAGRQVGKSGANITLGTLVPRQSRSLLP